MFRHAPRTAEIPQRRNVRAVGIQELEQKPPLAAIAAHPAELSRQHVIAVKLNI